MSKLPTIQDVLTQPEVCSPGQRITVYVPPEATSVTDSAIEKEFIIVDCKGARGQFVTLERR